MYELDSTFKALYFAAVRCALGTGVTPFSDTRAVFESFARALARHDLDAALSHVAEVESTWSGSMKAKGPATPF